MQSDILNVGHAELLVIMHVVNYVWTHPRNRKRVDNRLRAMGAANAMFDPLVELFNPGM